MATADELPGLAGMVLSLGLSNAPGLNRRYAQISTEKNRLLTLGLLVLTPTAVFARRRSGAGAIGRVGA